MSGPVLVIGASGNVGGAAAEALLAAGRVVRVAGTEPARLAARFPLADRVRLDFGDPGSFRPAIGDARAVVLVRPPAISRMGPTLNAFVDVAVAAGVEHVVFVSVAGAERNMLVPHHRVETHLRTSRVGWTILRPGFFAQNLADAYGADIRTLDAIVLPAAGGRAAFVDTRDIGQVCAVVLGAPAEHDHRGYHLTGGLALDFDQVAALLSAELGRDIGYRPVGPLSYLRHLHRAGLPAVQGMVQTVLHLGLRTGGAEVVDPTLARLLGRAPTTLEQYVHEHRETWLTARGPGVGTTG